jgi:tRNA 2-selenouridine synthase SelU
MSRISKSPKYIGGEKGLNQFTILLHCTLSRILQLLVDTLHITCAKTSLTQYPKQITVANSEVPIDTSYPSQL